MNEVMVQEKESYGIVFDNEKIKLLKDTICKGSTNEELQLFIHACKRCGLDPFMKQIHAVKRWDSNAHREVMSIQTGIDGYRLIAERTGRYVPGRETTYQYDSNGSLTSATAYIKKLAGDGSWHEVSATAFWSEYVASKKDGTPTNMWATKPHVMLGKCAEALVLRKAFPADLSGIYTAEEMEQASNTPSTISDDEYKLIEAVIEKTKDPQKTRANIAKAVKTTDLRNITREQADRISAWLEKKLDYEKTVDVKTKES